MGKIRVDVYNPTKTQKLHTFFEVGNPKLPQAINKYSQNEIPISFEEYASFALAKGQQLEVHTDKGLIGTYIYVDHTYDAGSDSIKLMCNDALYFLTQRTVGYGLQMKKANYESLFAQIQTLAAKAGWTVVQEGMILNNDPLDLIFEGESVFEAIMAIVKWTRGFVCLTGVSKQIKYGQFETSPANIAIYDDSVYGDGFPFYVYANSEYSTQIAGNKVLYKPTRVPYETADLNYALVESCTIENQGEVIANVIVPTGSGVFPVVAPNGIVIRQGAFDLSGCSYDPITYNPALGFVEQGITPNHKVWDAANKCWFICDPSSADTYGIAFRRFNVQEITPITPSVQDKINAADTLFQVAKFNLMVDSSPKLTYSLKVMNLPFTLKVGDLILLTYNDVIYTTQGERTALSIDKKFFYVTELTCEYDSGEPVSYTIRVSEKGEEITGVYEVMTNVLNGLERMRMTVNTSISDFHRSSPNLFITAQQVIQQETINAKAAEFGWKWNKRVAAVNELLVDVYVMRLFSPLIVSDSVHLGTDINHDGNYEFNTYEPVERPGKVTGVPSDQNKATLDIRHGHSATVYPAVNGERRMSGTYKNFSGYLERFYGKVRPCLIYPVLKVDNGNDYDPDGIRHIEWFLATTDETNYSTGDTLNPWQNYNQYGVIAQAGWDDTKLKNHRHIGANYDVNGIAVPVNPHSHDLMFGVWADADTGVPPDINLSFQYKIGTQTKSYIASQAIEKKVFDYYTRYTFDIQEFCTTREFRDMQHSIVVATTLGRANVFISVYGYITLSPVAIVGGHG